jgi:uncharacterized membrane protein YedE/YeeE
MDAVNPPLVETEAVRTRALPRWALLGGLFGLVSAASIALWGPIGVSGTYPRFIGALLRRLDPRYAEANTYLVKMGDFARPETFLVLGLFLGGFAASRFSAVRAPRVELIHPGQRSTRARYWGAFLGGVLIIFGARLAGGCTSGHILSGITQLAVSSMIFGAAVFATAILTARLLRARRR